MFEPIYDGNGIRAASEENNGVEKWAGKPG